MKTRFKKHKRKAFLSLSCYSAAIPLAYVNSYISITIFFVVAIIWLIPDKGILAPIDPDS